jgi:hypothetical protein
VRTRWLFASYIFSHPKSPLSASYSVQGVSVTFAYAGEPSCGTTPAAVRVFFQTGGKFAYTNYWWADVTPGSAALANGPGTLSALVDSAQAWSDWNGQPSSANAAALNAAAVNATVVGLSFGVGCFFENGVGTSDGSGSFTLSSFTRSPAGEHQVM